MLAIRCAPETDVTKYHADFRMVTHNLILIGLTAKIIGKVIILHIVTWMILQSTAYGTKSQKFYIFYEINVFTPTLTRL